MAARTIHPFPARMAPEIALSAIPEFGVGSEGKLTVIDPMCGSGTVLTAAIARGHDAVGVDIDPLAVLMSEVATAPIDTEILQREADRVVETASKQVGVAPWGDDETDAFVDFWFGPSQRKDLIALTTAISSVQAPSIRDALMVAVSRIIITKSPQASLAADTSHSRPHRVITESTYDVLAGFSRSVRTLVKLLDGRTVIGTARVSRGDSRQLNEVGSESIDLAVTSPPYLNALDYMRGHKLALVWHGHSIAHLRGLRGRSIGAERAPDWELSESVNEIVDQIQSQVVDPEKLPLGTLRRFAGDMAGFSGALRRVLKPGAAAVLVVGNSTLKGNYIRNDLIAQTALEVEGFSFEDRSEREIPATSRYMPINTRSAESSLRNRMRNEVVLTMRKSA